MHLIKSDDTRLLHCTLRLILLLNNTNCKINRIILSLKILYYLLTFIIVHTDHMLEEHKSD